MKNYMLIGELITGLRDGSIEVDFMGHDIPLRNDDTPYTYLDMITTSLNMDYEREYNYINSCELKGEDISTFRSQTIDRKYTYNKDFFIPNYSCPCCGKRLSILPINNNLVRLFNIVEYNPSTGEGEIKQCAAAEISTKQMLVSEINVLSGELIFFSYLDEFNLKSADKRISVNSLIGRNSLMQQLASIDIGYGQMTNTDISVYAKPDGTEILISTDLYYDDEGDEYEVEHVGYTKIGMISLNVWRWMCGDLTTLKANKVKIKKNLVQQPNKHTKNVRATVKPGKWVVEHYYDFPADNNLIYSRLYLKQEEPAN